MTQISQSCPNCGGDLKAVSGELLHCPYCESDFENHSSRRRSDILHEFLDQTKIEYVNNQRRNLYNAVCAKYISKNEVHQYATEIKNDARKRAVMSGKATFGTKKCDTYIKKASLV